MVQVTIKVKALVPGKEWEVLGITPGEDPIFLGTVEYDSGAYDKDDRWVPRGPGGTYPLTWCGTKTRAVRMCVTELLRHFAQVEVVWGKSSWRLERLFDGPLV